MIHPKQQLYAFGYGLSLFIPFLIVMQALKGRLSTWAWFGIFFTAFVLILWITTQVMERRPLHNAWLFLAPALTLGWKWSQGLGILSGCFLTLSLIILLVTLIRVDTLKPLFLLWMRLAHLLGAIVTTVILSVVFYGMFGIIGIALRLMRKDLLDQVLSPKSESYWFKREITPIEKKRYTQQF